VNDNRAIGRVRRAGLDIAPDALVLPVAIAVLILLAALGGEHARALLRYERAAALAGEWWRLASAHVVHLGWSHSCLNLAGLALVWTLFAPALRGWNGVRVLLASVAVIDAGFLLNEPQLDWYVGFSGALHGLFAAGVVAGIAAREREAWVLGALLVAKLAWEQWAGPVPFTEAVAGGPVVESAHLYGAVGGLCAQFVALRPRRRQL
jgi:rhomboid family GlyGly-CTERM serine protease